MFLIIIARAIVPMLIMLLQRRCLAQPDPAGRLLGAAQRERPPPPPPATPRAARGHLGRGQGI